MRYLRYRSISEIIAMIAALLACYQIFAYYQILPSVKTEGNIAILLKDLALSYISGFILYYLTSYLRWYKKIKATNQIINEVFVNLQSKLYEELKKLTHTEWKSSIMELRFQTKQDIAKKRTILSMSISNLNWTEHEIEILKTIINPLIGEIANKSDEVYRNYMPLLLPDALEIVIDLKGKTLYNKIRKTSDFQNKYIIDSITDGLLSLKCKLDLLCN